MVMLVGYCEAHALYSRSCVMAIPEGLLYVCSMSKNHNKNLHMRILLVEILN